MTLKTLQPGHWEVKEFFYAKLATFLQPLLSASSFAKIGRKMKIRRPIFIFLPLFAKLHADHKGWRKVASFALKILWPPNDQVQAFSISYCASKMPRGSEVPFSNSLTYSSPNGQSLSDIIWWICVISRFTVFVCFSYCNHPCILTPSTKVLKRKHFLRVSH